jgi:hypothetical protein
MLMFLVPQRSMLGTRSRIHSTSCIQASLVVPSKPLQLSVMKCSSLLGPFLSCEEKEMLSIQALMLRLMFLVLLRMTLGTRGHFHISFYFKLTHGPGKKGY